jgi:hypothetical protein
VYLLAASFSCSQNRDSRPHADFIRVVAGVTSPAWTVCSPGDSMPYPLSDNNAVAEVPVAFTVCGYKAQLEPGFRVNLACFAACQRCL